MNAEVREERIVWLYEKQKKIYPRAVSGWFAGWRWALVWATRCCSIWLRAASTSSASFSTRRTSFT
jgi:hypothetical protein